ncbi:uncharacterized protein L969DRAFT_19171 [Mixia osmundae IAM 14324]|uniref:uncharacterized protein n=1 Tax=Mixia osmundae (strain CBS 9802 / IAM 14324 / JCM 22182 / KY 12970) TaxID=764103 RepID=UPI0004A555EC|nr:uncharacterized protein L969DRAFT_19171 [Mixia osmundae IAM 14324]KEI37696.1 hypothetical protein L969DRAFT_19171 [Mixia osmundae IAM 14324]
MAFGPVCAVAQDKTTLVFSSSPAPMQRHTDARSGAPLRFSSPAARQDDSAARLAPRRSGAGAVRVRPQRTASSQASSSSGPLSGHEDFTEANLKKRRRKRAPVSLTVGPPPAFTFVDTAFRGVSSAQDLPSSPVLPSDSVAGDERPSGGLTVRPTLLDSRQDWSDGLEPPLQAHEDSLDEQSLDLSFASGMSITTPCTEEPPSGMGNLLGGHDLLSGIDPRAQANLLNASQDSSSPHLMDISPAQPVGLPAPAGMPLLPHATLLATSAEQDTSSSPDHSPLKSMIATRRPLMAARPAFSSSLSCGSTLFADKLAHRPKLDSNGPRVFGRELSPNSLSPHHALQKVADNLVSAKPSTFGRAQSEATLSLSYKARDASYQKPSLSAGLPKRPSISPCPVTKKTSSFQSRDRARQLGQDLAGPKMSSAPVLPIKSRPAVSHQKRLSEPSVPTYRTLASQLSDSATGLPNVAEALTPDAMDIDPASPAGYFSAKMKQSVPPPSIKKLATLILPQSSPIPQVPDSFGDLFNDLSPVAMTYSTRKRDRAEDEDQMSICTSPDSLTVPLPNDRSTNRTAFARAQTTLGIGNSSQRRLTKRPSLSSFVEHTDAQEAHLVRHKTSSSLPFAALAAQSTFQHADDSPIRLDRQTLKMRRAQSVCAAPAIVVTRDQRVMPKLSLLNSPGPFSDGIEASPCVRPPMRGRSLTPALDNHSAHSESPPRDDRRSASFQGVSQHPAHEVQLQNPLSSPELTLQFGMNEAEGKVLPCHNVKSDGLMRITAQTLKDVLSGVYDGRVQQTTIVDCRFDYEYMGGHVSGAINLASQDAVEDYFLCAGDGYNSTGPGRLPEPSRSGQPLPALLIFHCEFSAKRAPTMACHLRSKDRTRNVHVYPAVHYPEVYVLEDGYEGFWKQYPASRSDLCIGGYVPMDDPKHRTHRYDQLNKFRTFDRAKSYTFGQQAIAVEPAQQASRRLADIVDLTSSPSGTDSPIGKAQLNRFKQNKAGLLKFGSTANSKSGSRKPFERATTTAGLFRQ